MSGATHAALDHRQQVCTITWQLSERDNNVNALYVVVLYNPPLIPVCYQLLAGFQTPYPGAVTPGFSTPSGDLDLTKIGEARKSLVGVKLDQVMCLTDIIVLNI